MVTITHISDTHMSHEDLDLEAYPADILIHSGDFGAMGDIKDLMYFNAWMKDLPYGNIVNIAGNHDKICADMGYYTAKNMFTNSTYLEDNMVEIKGLKIYGTPWSQTFGCWSYMKHEGELEKIWAKIPEGIDVLVVHGPPHGILDKVGWRHTGSISLREHILERIKPKLVCFGHIHCDAGVTEVNGIKFSNASVLDDNYVLTQKPNTFVL